MACTNITVQAATPGVTISGATFGSTTGAFPSCTVPGSMVGQPIVIGFNFSGTGLINLLTVKATYTDYLGATVTSTKTGIVSALSGQGTIEVGRSYHAGNYSNLVISGTAAI